MARSRPKKKPTPAQEARLEALVARAAQQGLQVHFDLLEAAGLKLKDGICRINGRYHIFIDRRKSPADKIEVLETFLNQPLPKDVPEAYE